MFEMFSKSARALAIAEEARKLAVSNEHSVERAKRLANEALSRASQCEDRAVERGNEVANIVNQNADIWWKRWQDVVSALQKHSQDMHELDKRISELEGRRYLAEAEAKARPLIEIVDFKPAKVKRQTRGRMGPHKRLALLESKLKSGDLPRDLFDSAKQTIPLPIIALYECTGGYEMHKRGYITREKAMNGKGAKPYGFSVLDRTTRQTGKRGNPYERTSYYATLEERDNALSQINRYHELCRRYYTEKGRKP